MTDTRTRERPLQAAYEPPHETYGPGFGLTVGLTGIGLVALSLFAVTWLDVRDGGFVALSRQARHIGRHDLGTPVFGYLAWAGFVLLALTAGLVILAGIPIPRTAAGNSYARVIGAFVAALAAVLQTYVIVDAFPARLVAAGAWLGVAGYLVAIAGFVIGARRRVR